MDTLTSSSLLKHIIESSSSSEEKSSSDEDLIFIVQTLQNRKKHIPVKGYVASIASHYDDLEFQSHFGLTRTLVEKLLVEWKLGPIKIAVGKPPIRPIEALLLALWVLCHQESFRSTADRFGFNRGHAHHTFIKMMEMIAKKQRFYIKFDDLKKTVEDFSQLRGRQSFPNVAGCVDVCHIKIPPPKNDDSFCNQIGQSSMILQGICNARREFIDIFCGWPGSSHDSVVWKNSLIYERLKTENILPEEFHLLGDTAFPLDTFIMVPFKDNGHLTPQEKRFNVRLNSSRVVIEQAFGRLKGIFQRLKCLNILKLSYFKCIVVSACILHNITIREKLSSEYDTTNDEDNVPNEPYEGSTEVSAENKRNSIMFSLAKI